MYSFKFSENIASTLIDEMGSVLTFLHRPNTCSAGTRLFNSLFIFTLSLTALHFIRQLPRSSRMAQKYAAPYPYMDAHFCQGFQAIILRVRKDCSHTSGFSVRLPIFKLSIISARLTAYAIQEIYHDQRLHTQRRPSE